MCRGQAELQAVAQLLADLVRQVEQKALLLTGAHRLGPEVGLRIGPQHLQLHGLQRLRGLRQQPTQFAKTVGLFLQVQRGQVAGQQPAFVRAETLRAEQQLGGAQLEGIGVVQQAAQHRLHDGVDEQWRSADVPAAPKGPQPAFQRAGPQQAIAQREEVAVVLARIGILQAAEFLRADGAQRVGRQGFVQGDLLPAGLGQQGQFGSRHPRGQPGGCRPQPAVVSQFQQRMAAARPEVRFQTHFRARRGGGADLGIMPWSHREPDVTADDFSRLLQAHRSIRQYKPDPLPAGLIDRVLSECLAGSSSSGNLNTVSVIKTQDPLRKSKLHELHFNQPMVLQAPLVLTFCADTHRTRTWLEQRDARPGFADLLSWHVSAFDAIILSQTVALALESHGLGICYMGTTLHSMRDIADFMECPPNVLPATSMVVGWPDEAPPQRDRLPIAAWVHEERYQAPTPAAIDTHFAERERRGRERYLAMGAEMAERWKAHGITHLAQFYTSKLKYDPDQFAIDSAALELLLRERGFMVD